MTTPRTCLMMLGLSPLALAACVELEPAVAQPQPAGPAVAADLGGSSRIPRIAGLVAEAERVGETQAAAAHHDHGSMLGMHHGAPHGAGHGHSSGAGSPTAHAGHGHDHGMTASRPSAGKQTDHAGHGHNDPASKPRPPGSGTKMAHAGHDHGAAVSRPAAGKQMAHSGHGDDQAAGKPRPAGTGTKMAHSGHAHAKGTGTVNSIDAASRKMNVTHDPIPAIGWPTMTMDFAVAPSVDLNALRPGTRVNFQMEQGQGGMYVIQSITPAAGGRR